MLVVVVSVQVMVIDVAVCMVAVRLLGGLGKTSVLVMTTQFNTIKFVVSIHSLVNTLS